MRRPRRTQLLPIAWPAAGAGDLLIHGFDGVPSYGFGCLVTLRRKVLPSCRVVKCLRLIQAVPLGDGHAHGRRRALHGDHLSTTRVEWMTTRRFLRSQDG